MKNKINIAELLKDCPKGMELDCTICNGVKFIELDRNPNFPIVVRANNDYEFTLTKYGQVHNIDESKCVIFPKGKTTWEGFVPPCKFKDGDIISDSFGSCIFKGEGKIKGTVDYYCGISSDSDYFSVKDNKCRPDGHYGNIVDYRLATEEEKEKLFQAIKENGYNWNPETKTLEKLNVPIFKVGDRIRLKSKPNYVCTINSLTWDDNNKLAYRLLPDNDKHLRVISLIAQNEYELIPNKFDVTTLKPFDKVLVRNDESQYWIPAFWGYKRDDGYTTTFGWSKYCVPFAGNEHLLETTNDCNEYYKTWK